MHGFGCRTLETVWMMVDVLNGADAGATVPGMGELNPVDPLAFGDIGDDFEGVFEDPTAPSAKPAPVKKPRTKRYLSSDQPMRGWIPLQDKYLAELIRLEGRGDVCLTHCPTCPENTTREPPRYRCQDCMVPDLFCHECVRLEEHSQPGERRTLVLVGLSIT
ncbi:hypothetical protein B0H14DRAFT_3535082 [Mycena olivaceomarginata]|nr:hypothetical protein B0H14DRAFT_3535082 [Mycena olivaceomarginata]